VRRILKDGRPFSLGGCCALFGDLHVNLACSRQQGSPLFESSNPCYSILRQTGERLDARRSTTTNEVRLPPVPSFKKTTAGRRVRCFYQRSHLTKSLTWVFFKVRRTPSCTIRSSLTALLTSTRHQSTSIANPLI
jgi:hypothetical protein